MTRRRDREDRLGGPGKQRAHQHRGRGRGIASGKRRRRRWHGRRVGVRRQAGRELCRFVLPVLELV